MQDGLASKLFSKKRAEYKNIDINVIAPSSWMESKVRESSLLGNARIHRIPNALDTTVYKPCNKSYSQHVLNINHNKKIIAFGAISALKDPNKGYELLASAIRMVSNLLEDIMVVIFGEDNNLSNDHNLGCEVKYIGKLSDDISLSLVYAAADVVVVPSKQESYSQVSAESIACGTPVVAFNSTGPKDIIDHKINGYLAVPYEIQDLAAGILWVLEDEERRLLLSENARKKAMAFCSYEIIAKKHLELYDELADE
jgi:glycosyltransferase involved in cell wall biosynthesis